MSVKFSFWTLIIIFCITLCFINTLENTNRFVVRVNKTYWERIKQIFEENNISVLFQVTQKIFVVIYNGTETGSEVLRRIADENQNQIESWEPLRVYDNELKPTADTVTPQTSFQSLYTAENDLKKFPVCKSYYGMGVEDVWKRNYTGRNVIIAITDVGINVDLLDLKNSIDHGLCKNFIQNVANTSDVTPEVFPEMTYEAVELTDHGNRIASVIAAEKGNNICSAGIAFGSKIVALKVFEVKYDLGKLKTQLTDGEKLAKSFLHPDGPCEYTVENTIKNTIDIFVNGWTPTKIFDPLDMATLGALAQGVDECRRKLGNIYLVPTGLAGNKLSNNIHTITVGSVSQNGTVPKNAIVDASVIVSGLAEGNHLNASYIVTSTLNNTCVTSFKGTSLASAQVAGIIALAFEVNRHLSQREVLHLLVQSAEHTGLLEEKNFIMNNGGKYVHPYFGFGLLNADKFVALAADNVGNGRASLLTNSFSNGIRHSYDWGFDVSFCFQCLFHEECVTNIEYVEVSIQLEPESAYFHISVMSPSETESVLMDQHVKKFQIANMTNNAATFVSAHFWNEIPFGEWTVRVKTDAKNINITTIIFYGTYNTQHAHTEACGSTKNTTLNETANGDLDKSETGSGWKPFGIIVAVSILIIICVFIYEFRKKICTNRCIDRDTVNDQLIALSPAQADN